MYFLDEFEELKANLDDKTSHRLQMDLVLRLIIKLNEMGINDETLVNSFEIFLESVRDYHEGREPRIRFCSKHRTVITDYALREHKLAYKGYHTSLYLGLGLIFGTVLGTVFSTVFDTVFYAVGTGVGLAIGVALGSAKEAKTKNEGKIY